MSNAVSRAYNFLIMKIILLKKKKIKTISILNIYEYALTAYMSFAQKS